MKRLTSILLALLMLVGMALAEETPDPILGDWYTADGLICFTFRADGTFTYVIDGTWSKSEDGEYLLTYDDNTQDLLNLLDGTVDGEIPEADMTARLTTDGLVITCFGAPEGTEIYLLRDAVDFQTPWISRRSGRPARTRRWKPSRGRGRWKPCSSARCS